MPRTTHTYNVNCAIPQNLSDTSVIGGLHAHENLLTLQPLVSSYHEIASTNDPEPDPYFNISGSPIKTYEVTERVIIIPAIGKWGTYPVTIILDFQNVEGGLKSRALASGVVVRATYTVNQSDASYSSLILAESVTVECASWLMPFVKRSMEGAHKDLCRKFLERIASQ
jgi:hypothetical protein